MLIAFKLLAIRAQRKIKVKKALKVIAFFAPISNFFSRFEFLFRIKNEIISPESIGNVNNPNTEKISVQKTNDRTIPARNKFKNIVLSLYIL